MLTLVLLIIQLLVLTLVLLIIQLLVLGILAWGVCEYIRLRHLLCNIKRRMTMDIDGVIDGLLEADDTSYHAEAKHDTKYQRQAGPERTHGGGGEATGTATTSQQVVQQHWERLAALVAGGRARQYLGKALSVDQVDNMEEEEVEKFYGHYEARLGAAMTKTLGAAALQLYTSAASMFLPIPPEEQPELLSELEADHFVEHAVSSATCEMYHWFGMYLAPVTAALTTLRHCRFGQQDVPRIVDDTDVLSYQSDGNSANTRVDGWGGECDSACTCFSRGFAEDKKKSCHRAGRSGGQACAPGQPSCRAPHGERGN